MYGVGVGDLGFHLWRSDRTSLDPGKEPQPLPLSPSSTKGSHSNTGDTQSLGQGKTKPPLTQQLYLDPGTDGATKGAV